MGFVVRAVVPHNSRAAEVEAHKAEGKHKDDNVERIWEPLFSTAFIVSVGLSSQSAKSASCGGGS